MGSQKDSKLQKDSKRIRVFQKMGEKQKDSRRMAKDRKMIAEGWDRKRIAEEQEEDSNRMSKTSNRKITNGQ